MQLVLEPAPPPPPPPAWLKALAEWLRDLLRPVGRFLRWVSSWMPDAPYARIILWTAIVLGLAGIGWMVWQRFRHGEWRLPRRRTRAVPVDAPAEEEWAPEEARSRAWLEEADALAAAGRYAEAAHHLLFRSVEDLARRRPRLVRPALTSRELAAAEGVPETARALFARIAGVVERSLFGGRAVDAEDWRAARADYQQYALPGTWRG